jgi:hypothetical protein
LTENIDFSHWHFDNLVEGWHTRRDVNDFYMDFSGTFTWSWVEFDFEFCIKNVNETQSSSVNVGSIWKNTANLLISVLVMSGSQILCPAIIYPSVFHQCKRRYEKKHISLDLIKCAKDNNVSLLKLPSHTTHFGLYAYIL